MRISTLIIIYIISLFTISNTSLFANIEKTIINSDSTINTEKNKGKAFTFEAAYTGDFLYNMTGGNKQGFAYLGNIDLIVSFDTEKANLWKGGTLFAYGLNNHGT